MAVMMGGKTAEEIVFGEATTGASDDLQRASKVARRMVTEFGMSETLGPRAFDESGTMVFLGKELTQGRNYSDAVAKQIDSEIGKLLNRSKATAVRILTKNRARLDRLAGRLIEVETLTATNSTCSSKATNRSPPPPSARSRPALWPLPSGGDLREGARH